MKNLLKGRNGAFLKAMAVGASITLLIYLTSSVITSWFVH